MYTVLFCKGNQIGLLEGEQLVELESEYLRKYKKSRKEICDRNEWKRSGTGAQFTGAHREREVFEEERIHCSINGYFFVGHEIIYSISIDRNSGIFRKDTDPTSNQEGHVIHGETLTFMNMDYNETRDEVVLAISNQTINQHIGIMKLETSRYEMITEGDCIDANPMWSMSREKCIYYDSKGIGRLENGVIGGFSPIAICQIDLNEKMIKEIIEIEGHDCFLPKDDEEGNLYFIKRPVNHVKKKGNSFINVVTIPFKVGKAIYKWMEFFTMRYTGETFNTAGATPARSKEKTPEELFIQGNLINVLETMKENEKLGDKYPGIIPKSWQLMKKTHEGELICIKKGVLDYDVVGNGDIIYSNGKYLVLLTPNGEERIIKKVDLALKIKIKK